MSCFGGVWCLVCVSVSEQIDPGVTETETKLFLMVMLFCVTVCFRNEASADVYSICCQS